MAYFKIIYSISRDEIKDEEYVELNSYDEAVNAAYEAAIEYYDSLAGFRDIPSLHEVVHDMFTDKIEQEYNDFLDNLWEYLSEGERDAAYKKYTQERESRIDYKAIEVSKEEYDSRRGSKYEEDK